MDGAARRHRVLRGGGFNNDPRNVRCAYRNRSNPDNHNMGFRVVVRTFLESPEMPGVHIHEPKRRLISAAPFRDRVAHHALCGVTEPLFERSFIADSYANRIGKGTHRALDRCQHFARRHRYVMGSGRASPAG